VTNLQIPHYLYIDALEQLANQHFSSLNLLGGVVMGKIGSFPIFMHQNHYKQIQKKIEANFTSYQPIKGQEVLGMTVSYSESITLNGVVVAQPINELKPLEWMVKMGKPTRFTTLDSDIDIVIKSLQQTQTLFYPNGEHTVNKYNLTFKGVYGDLSQYNTGG